MSSDSLGFGIIGCGMISKWHAEAISRVDGAHLIGVTDVNENSRISFSKKFGVKAFATVHELLSDPDINIVNICTPSGLHAQLAIEAIKAGKHVLVEKPMSLNLKEADEIIDACSKYKVKLGVVSQLRFSDAVRKLKAAVNGGELGKLISGDIYMKYYRSQEYYDAGGWRGTWMMDGGGALMNQGIHGVDLLQYVMGPVKSVFAHARTLARNIEVEDTAVAILEFENGAVGVIEATTSVYPGSPRRLEICGDRGTVVLEEDRIISWVTSDGTTYNGKETRGSGTNTASNPAALDIKGHMMQIENMVQAVRKDEKPFVDQYDGRKPIEIITAVYESSRTGKPVKLGTNKFC